jgi:autotransporter-associated beta strand protein
MRTQFGTILAAAVAVTFHGVASGAVITNANDVTVNVELGPSWVGGVAPGASDTAVFEAVNTTTRFKAGADLSYYGMEWRHPAIIAPIPGIGISAATGNETLTVGAGGMTFLPLGSGGGPRIYIDMPVVVSAAQTWQSLRNGDGHVYPHFTKAISVNANLAIQMTKSKDMASAYEPITVANGAKITVSGNVPALILRDNARVAGTLEVASGSGFCLAPTNSAPVHFSNLLSSFVNNCYFYLGGYEGYYSDHVSKVLFGQGDALTTTATSTDRSASSLRVYDADVTVDGGDVRTRWFRLHNGHWTLNSGNVWFDYQNVIGCGTIHSNRIVKAQTFNVQGGTYTFRRVAVGVANSDEIPARLLVSGGTAESDLLGTTVDNSTEWWSGLDIAVRWINGEQENDGDPFVSVYAAGDVLVSGNGKLSVPRISFGGNKAVSASSTTVTNGAGRLRMTGGEIEMGTAGFVLGNLWGPAGKAWYDVTFSGGKLTALTNGARQNLNVRLSNANGGITYDVGSGHTYTVGSPMFGSGGLVKTGAGTMVLNCGNDYTGRTEIAAGSLVVKSASAATGAAYTPAGTTCPNATMRLVADDLAAANGASVSSWTAHSGSSPASVFTLSTAQNSAILGSGATAPVVTTDGFNGHKALSFNGVSSALAAGGADAPWVSSGNGSTTGFSVAMVVRFDGWGEGTSAYSWLESRPFFGVTKSGYGDAYVWNFALTGAGQLQGGSAWAKKDKKVMADWLSPITARPVPRFLDDGRPHVVVMTLPTYNQADGKVTMTVDGYRSENTAVWTNATTLGYGKSYTMLGGSDLFNKKYYTPCSIAEIRFWRGTQLSEAQIKAFSEEMAATYGAELDGYTTFGVSGQHSKEVHVASGASYGTDEANFTLPLYAGQTLSGAGSVIGKMSAQAGSTIALSASGSPTFADLTLADGAAIKIADDCAATLTATNLTVGANDVIDVDVSAVADARHSVNLISFTSGTATADNFRVVPANPLYLFKVVDGKVRLSCINGTQILFR